MSIFLYFQCSYEHKTSCSLCKKIVRQEYLEHLKEEEERIFQERLKTQVIIIFISILNYIFIY